MMSPALNCINSSLNLLFYHRGIADSTFNKGMFNNTQKITAINCDVTLMFSFQKSLQSINAESIISSHSYVEMFFYCISLQDITCIENWSTYEGSNISRNV